MGRVLIVMDFAGKCGCLFPETSLDSILGSASILVASDSLHVCRDTLRRGNAEIALLDHGGQCALTGRLRRFFEIVSAFAQTQRLAFLLASSKL